MIGKFTRIYDRLPVWAQHAAFSAYGVYWRRLRFGPGFRESLRDYLERERYTLEQWRAWQNDQLRKILPAAAQTVPYYVRAWGQSERAAARQGRLVDLPLLSKEGLRADPWAFVRENVRPHPHLVFCTSGSTGTPIKSIWTVRELRDSMALREARSARWAGVSYRMPRATFSGRLVEPDPKSRGPFYRFNLAERQVYYSAFHVRPDTAEQYVAALRRHGIRWMTGYTSSFYSLACFILEQGLEVPPLEALITTSEKLTPPMRQTMERAFGCRVFEEYSTVENALFAHECERGCLHISPDVGVVEILRPDGSVCEPLEVGEVVTTCLMRTGQPLIRYRIGDLAMWDPDPCPCGRAMPVLREVVGRVDDVVIGPDGRELARFNGMFADLPNIRASQVVQETLTHLRVKVEPTAAYTEADSREIVRRVQQRLGSEVGVDVEPVESIPRSAAGKLRAVISHLKGRSEARTTARCASSARSTS